MITKPDPASFEAGLDEPGGELLVKGRVVPKAALLAISLIVVACSSVESADSTTTVAPITTAATTTMPPTTTVASTSTLAPTTTVSPGLIATLPRCEGGAVIPASTGAGQIGFIIGDAVYVADPDGSGVQCVTGEATDGPFVWGPAGDRLVAGQAVTSAAGSAPALTAAVPTWSRPTGTSLVWVDGGRLLKAGIHDAQARDLTFLASHDAVTYHPAGVEIATTGQADDGTRGVWLATNDGSDPRLLVRADEATVHDFTFTHDGIEGYFLADHGDRWHVHDIFLVLDPGDDADEFDASIRYESAGPLSHLVVSPWDFLWAAQDGECGSGSRVVIGDATLAEELTGVEAFPVGWLPGQQLVVAAYAGGCDRPVDLWIVDVTGGSSSATLLVSAVDGAAIRAAVPDPPPPLGDIAADEFA